MKNAHIKVLLLLLFAAVAALIAWEFISKRPGRQAGNPWEYNVDEFVKTADSSLIKYNEVLNIQLDTSGLAGIAYAGGRIYIVGNDYLQAISTEGRQFYRLELKQTPKCIFVSGGFIFIAYAAQIEKYDVMGEFLHSWEIYGENPAITSLAAYEGLLFAADASNRRVLRYTTEGEFLGFFEGKSETDQLHGFIIPSGCFDLAISGDGELWVVNPGKHALELYSHDGRLLRFWESASFNPEGFSGCCNPVHIAILSDGSFVTSEKGIFRIKVHKAFGDLYGFVASPDYFEDASIAPDVAVSPEGLIYALDFNRNMVRIFEHK